MTEAYDLPDFWHNGTPRQVAAWRASDELVDAKAERLSPMALDHPVYVEHRLRVRGLRGWGFPRRQDAVRDPAFQLTASAGVTNGLPTFVVTFRSLTDHLDASRVAEYRRHVERARTSAQYEIEASPWKRTLTSPPGLIIVVVLAFVAGAALAVRRRSRFGRWR